MRRFTSTFIGLLVLAQALPARAQE